MTLKAVMPKVIITLEFFHTIFGDRYHRNGGSPNLVIFKFFIQTNVSE